MISTPARYDELLMSAISLWEFAKLLEKRRLAISCDPEEWIREALEMPKLRLVARLSQPGTTTVAAGFSSGGPRSCPRRSR